MDKTTFWTVFKADLLFSACSMAVGILITIALTLWRRKRKKAQPPPKPDKGPRMYMIGGTDPAPGHCPLCGQGWPLTGPGGSRKVEP